MDPYVYIAYLCFLENNNSIRKNFIRPGDNFFAESDLRFAIGEEACTMRLKAQYTFMYEDEYKWRTFSFSYFITWLKQFRK